uniref:Exonuclease 3'-5' domain-containing protein 2 n=1 Tax=Bracon brevicornis TaxID=1563983 RepID=A0A6V7LYJ6_9HYME
MQRIAKRQHSIVRHLVFFIKSIYNWGYRNTLSYVHDLPSAVVDIKFRDLPESPLSGRTHFTNSDSVVYNKNTNNQLSNSYLNGESCYRKGGNDTTNNNSNNNNSTGTNNNDKNKKSNCDETLKTMKVYRIPTRKEPLYDNCYLQAPDGETLCTCDRKKAEWYVKKGLGLIVIAEPLTVRLNFEPSGRAHGQVGQYYTQVKVNQCVVCGSRDKFIKKNVVPKEYRKYFPLVMKAHQSHDVLLLCPTCHEISNKHDLDFRRHLASIYDAPLSQSLPLTRSDHNHQKRKFLSAVNALKANPALPLQRKKELEARVLEYSSTIQQNSNYDENENIDNDTPLKSTGPTPLSSPLQARVKSHGLKVVEYFINSEGGLVALETMWREHFLASMRPKYLPKLWSVSHNQERLKIRCIENRIEPDDVKVAGLKDSNYTSYTQLEQ